MTSLLRSRRGLFAALLLILLVGVLYFPTWRWLAHEWWTNDYYSHGLLVAPLTIFLLWRRLSTVGEPLPANWGLLPLLAGLTLHLYGLWRQAYFLSAVSLPILAGGLIALFLGGKALRVAAFPLAFFWLGVPLPFVETASYPLQTITAAAASALARVLGIDADLKGAQITLPACSLQVGAPCSGLRSIVALITLNVLLAYIVQGTIWARALIILMAVPIAIAANIIRVTLLLIVANTWGAEAGLSYFHDFSSPVLFLVAVLLSIGLSWGVGCREIRADI